MILNKQQHKRFLLLLLYIYSNVRRQYYMRHGNAATNATHLSTIVAQAEQPMMYSSNCVVVIVVAIMYAFEQYQPKCQLS